MNKNLLTTTALVTLFAGSAFADGMTYREKRGLDVNWGGSLDAQLGASSQKEKYKGDRDVTPNADVAIDTEARIWLEAKGKTSGGMTYGAHVGISPNVNFSSDTRRNYMDRTYLFMETKDMGRLEAGSNEGAGDMFTLGAGNVAAATGGASGGDWWKYAVLYSSTAAAGNTQPGDFILNPALPMDNDITIDAASTGKLASREKARKITFLSPKWDGFQFGLSYIPDVFNNGNKAVLPNTISGGTDQAQGVSGGFMWEGKMDKEHMLRLSLVGDWGKVRRSLGSAPSITPDVKDTGAVVVGGTWDYRNFMTGASYGWLGDTDAFKSTTNNVKDSWFATLGFGVKSMDNKMMTSLTGMYSERNKNEAYVVSLGADYQLAAGLLPYAEVTYFKMDGKNTGGFNRSAELSTPSGGVVSNTSTRVSTAADTENKGVVFILGTKVTF